MSALHVVSPTHAEVQTCAQKDIVRALYREHAARLAAIAGRMLRNHDAGEDLVQDAFLSMLEGDVAIPAVDVLRKLEAIVRKECDARRKQMARERSSRRMQKEARRAYAATVRSLARGGPVDDGADDHEVCR